MKLFILGVHLVLVLTYLEDGKANRTLGRGKASNTGNTRSRSVKATSTKSSAFSHVSLPNKSYSKKPQISQPRLDKVKYDPKKVSKPGQGRKSFKQKNKMTPKNKQKVADIKVSLRKFVANKKSGINKQNDYIKVNSRKKKTKKTTQDIKAALNKYLKNKKSNKPTTNLKNSKTNSHSTIASALRSFVRKQKGVNTGSSNKPRKLPRRICKRSASGSDCVLPDLNEDAKPSTQSLETEEERRNYLKNNPNIKVNEENLLGTVKKHDDDTGPDVIFLEKGNMQAGLTHILEDDLEVGRKGHREDFKKSFDLQGKKGKFGNHKDIDSQIEQIILKAAASKSAPKPTQKKKDKVAKNSSGAGVLKEVEWNGSTKKINLAIGNNGFIVSSYPASSDKAIDAPKPDTDTQLGNNGELSKNQQKKADKRAEQKARKEARGKVVIPEPNTGAGAA